MNFKKLAALVLAGAMTLSLVACGAPAPEAPATEAPAAATEAPVVEAPATEAPAAETYKIGILAPAVTHGWVAAVAYNAEVRCKELADQVEYKVVTSNNAEEMTTQLDELKTWGADAVVAFPQWEGMEVPIQQCIDDGIPVVNFDIEIAADGVYRVSGDNYDMGYQGAQYVVDKVGTEGTVVILDVPTSGSVAELRKQGFLEHLAELAPNMKTVEYATLFTREAGLTDMSDILTANPQIDAVYSMDDETSIGAIQAIRDAGRTDIKVITGGGGCQEYFNMMLAEENQDLWIESALYSPAMVQDAVDMAIEILSGNAPADPVKIIPTTIVDRDNVEGFLDANTPY